MNWLPAAHDSASQQTSKPGDEKDDDDNDGGDGGDGDDDCDDNDHDDDFLSATLAEVLRRRCR